MDPQAQPGPPRGARHRGGAPREAASSTSRSAARSVDVTEVSEVALTQAIVKLTRQEQKKVYFLDGHNERVIEGEKAAEGDGMKDAAEALAERELHGRDAAARRQGRGARRRRRGDRGGSDAAARTSASTRRSSATSRARRRAARAARSARGHRPRRGPREVGRRARRRRDRGPRAGPVRPARPRPSPPSTATTRSRASSATPRMFHVARSVQPAAEAQGALAPIVRTGEALLGRARHGPAAHEGRGEPSTTART